VKEIKTMSKLAAGAIIRGMHGTWTVVGIPILAREGGRHVWKVLANYETRRGERSAMVLTVPADANVT
jgi:hypothetical protein